MFRTLLFATVVGAGVGNAANVPAPGLDARSNSPPSYFCSSNVKKCSKQKPAVNAYCSSYLGIPKVTKTTTQTYYSTKTNMITSVTGTSISPPKTVTSTITSCAPPTATMAPVNEDEGNVSENEESVSPIEGGQNVKRNAPPTYKPAVYKPSYLESHRNKKALSAACKCYSIKPSTKTVTKSKNETKTVTRTKKTAATVAGATSTTYVYPEPTFLVANDRGGYAIEECFLDMKLERSGTGRLIFDDADSNALLFALNAADGLTALEGPGGNAYETVAFEGEDPDYGVQIGTPDEVVTTTPLSCSISQLPDGTCPLDCTVSADGNDVNQGNGFDDWSLGPPNTVTDLTYKTFAVTRGDPSQRGGVGGCVFRGRGGGFRSKGR